MIKFFISHKLEDAGYAKKIATELALMKIPCYLDLIDSNTEKSGKALTDHIKNNLNDCTDIIVVMSRNTRFSQWVPFEVGMSAQRDMPTATFLQEHVELPEFLAYWPRLKRESDIRKYVDERRKSESMYPIEKYLGDTRSKVEYFYDRVKDRL